MDVEGLDVGAPVAGWYPDPWGVARVRWWDGLRWTWRVDGPPGGSAPRRDRPRLLLRGALVAAVLAMVSLGVAGLLRAERELTAGIFDAAWSPDAASIAYATDDGIWLVPADGSHEPRRLHPNTGGLLQWAPDGSSVSFLQDRGFSLAAEQPFSLWVVHVGTGSAHHLADSSGPHRCNGWAPDSRHVAFSGPDRTIVLVDASTGRQRSVIAMGPDWVGCASWTPDGTRILVGGTPAGGGVPGIWVVTVADSGHTLLRAMPDVSDLQVVLQVGEPRIAVERCTGADLDPADPFHQRCQWFTMGLDGSNLHGLDGSPDWLAKPSGKRGAAGAWWSPDGTRRAWVSGSGTASELWVEREDGSGRVRVARL